MVPLFSYELRGVPYMKTSRFAWQGARVSRLSRALVCALFLWGSCSGAQAPATTQGPQASPRNVVPEPQGIDGTEILSDTQGVDFNPYLHKILKMIYAEWLRVLPEDAHPPQKLAGETLIRFTINPDGQVASMHLDGSTHSDPLNRAAWGAITRVGTFPQLPEAFHGPHLELRIHFKVNE